MSGISPLLKENGDFAVQNEDKANTLNQYLSSVFIQENPDGIPRVGEGERSNGTLLSDIVITPSAVTNKLSLLNNHKAQGPDNIPPMVLMELSKQLGLPLSILFNKSLEEGKLPRDWKRADVIAIYKKGTKSVSGNYRPVSLTCVICKVLESIIRDVMIDHMSLYKLYSDCQHGFRKGRSCITQLLQVMEDFTTFIDNGKSFDIIYFDFRKAFDQVPHRRLLCKLYSYGCSGNVLRWIRDFLLIELACNLKHGDMNILNK